MGPKENVEFMTSDYRMLALKKKVMGKYKIGLSYTRGNVGQKDILHVSC